MKAVILSVYRKKWGNYEMVEEEFSKKMKEETLQNLYSKVNTKWHLSSWIKNYWRQQIIEMSKSQTEMSHQQKADLNTIPEEEKQPDSKGRGLKRKNSPREQEGRKELSKKRKNKPLVIGTDDSKEDYSPDPQTLASGSAQHKKQLIFRPPKEKNQQAPSSANKNVFEDFKEFQRIPKMVKNESNEIVKIHDMNRVLSKRIQDRYRTTDRFLKLEK